MYQLVLKLLATVMTIILIDLAFQYGIWEPMAKPASHAGTSVRLKRALNDPHLKKIDFVTLGSSRPEYGIDHAALASAAQARGLVHADLSMPGTHWMTIGILGKWLARHHPEIRGGVIALSIPAFTNPGNGSYELGIVYPFHSISDLPWMAKHIPFNRNGAESWGVWSGLFAWREDIRDYVVSPRHRNESIQWFKENKTWEILFHNPESTGDMCAFGLDSLDACDRIEASQSKQAEGLRNQCRQLRNAAKNPADYDVLRQRPALPPSLSEVRRLVRAQLKKMKWSTPPVIVLMPVPTIWTEHASPKGLHDWAVSVLQPLVASGDIRLIDGTDFFNHNGSTDCHAFFDFYHQNAHGREAFSRWLLPQIETDLYQAPSD